MIIYPSLPSGHVVFCDDVRHEVTGKVTLVGVYGNHMFVSSIPAVIPRMWISVVYREAMDTFGPVAIRVIQEIDEKETVLVDVGYDVPANDGANVPQTSELQFREARFTLEIAPLNVDGPCKLKVRAFRGDDEVRLGALNILSVPEDADGQ